MNVGSLGVNPVGLRHQISSYLYEGKGIPLTMNNTIQWYLSLNLEMLQFVLSIVLLLWSYKKLQI